MEVQKISDKYSHVGFPRSLLVSAFEADAFVSAEMIIGNLGFGGIDYGGILRLTPTLQTKIRIGEEVEAQKCTALAMEAVDWVPQGPPKESPSRQRIDGMAAGIRRGGGDRAGRSHGNASDFKTNVAREIEANYRDVTTANKE